MERKEKTDILLRFMKDENIYQTVINSIKYYNKLHKMSENIYQTISDASCNGIHVYNLFEWIFRLQLIRSHKYIHKYNKNRRASDKKANLYKTKWLQYLEKNNYKLFS